MSAHVPTAFCRYASSFAAECGELNAEIDFPTPLVLPQLESNLLKEGGKASYIGQHYRGSEGGY